MVALPYGIAAGTLAVWGTVLVQNVRPFGVSEVLAILSTQQSATMIYKQNACYSSIRLLQAGLVFSAPYLR